MSRFRNLIASGFVLLAVIGASVSGSPDPGPPPGAALRFQGKFELVPLFGRDHQPVLRSGHQYYAERDTISFVTDAGDRVTAFAGSTTDLASIPPVVWPLMPPDGPWAEAAAFHDPCFKSLGTFEWKGRVGRTRPRPYTEHECNEILREAMVQLGVPAWKRIAIFEAVELFGARGWGR